MNEHYLKGQASTRLSQWNARILLAICALLTYAPLEGQNEFKGYAFNPKAGICIGKDLEGFGAGLEFNLIRNKTLLSFDIYTGAEFTILGSNSAKFRQIGVLYGRYTGTEHFRLQYQGGIAPTWGTKKGYYTDMGDYVEAEPYATFGLTGKVGLKLLLSPGLSVGVDLEGNLNPKNPMFFPSVSIEIGKLKERDAFSGGDNTVY